MRNVRPFNALLTQYLLDYYFSSRETNRSIAGIRLFARCAEKAVVPRGVDHDVSPMLNLRNEIYSRPIYPSNYDRNYASCRDIL